jgi:TonB family protein
MAAALLYQPGPRWRVGAALGAAALIYFAAVGLATIHRHDQIDEVPSVTDEFPPIDFLPDSPADSATPPPDLVDLPPIRDPSVDESFPDKRPSPPPIRRQANRLVTSTVKAGIRSPGSLTLSSAKVLAVTAPRPEYPYEARRQKITGSGIVVVSVDPLNGTVTDVSMWQSTGSPVLDNAKVAAFRRWRFKPGSVSRVKSPITFTMTGAAY